MTFRKILSLDIETRSDVDLVKRGVYNYVNAPFSILWLTYAYDYGERVTLDLWDDAIPQQLVDDIKDPTVLKVAANATFERICFSRVFGIYLAPESWTCTLVLAGRNGLPMHLDGAAAQARVNVQKHTSGKELIKMFSIPQKPTKKNNGVIWINPQDAPEQWQAYGHYNNIDVAAETDVRLAIKNNMPVSEFEETLYHIDQRINDRGVLIDLQFVEQAIRMNQIFTERVKAEVIQITGVQNPNSRNQLLEWLNGATPGNFENFTKLDKDTVQGIINGAPEPIIQKVLEARQYISKASVAKYAAMKNYACADGRARGFLKFYKANRTGRWAGTGIQPHNLTKHKCSPEQLDVMRELIKAGDVEGLAAVNKGDLTGALSQCVRTSFIAKPGHHFLVSDYSAIEARVLAWLAGETWRLEFFKGEGDIYIESAARMFKVPADSIGKKDPLRQNGKVAELACLGGDTLVLTEQDGWVRLIDIKLHHKVWDGDNWVEHKGLIFKGHREVIWVSGVYMTEDHKVLTLRGWTSANECNGELRGGDTMHTPLKVNPKGLKSIKVYDLLDCGTQNRFTVRERGYVPFIVHNCGYQGGVGALIQMDRDGAIDQKLMPSIIKLWREENPAIVAFWKNLENAALKALVTHDQYIPVGREPKIWFYFNSKSGNLHMVLPSGRWLTYVRAKIVTGKFGNSAVQYEGVENGKWSKLDTYGGKWAENATQAVARDILAHGIYNLDRAGFEIVLHVHDETVSEEPINGRSLEEVNHLMCLKAPWYEDLPLKAEGFVSPYYKKDDK